MNRDYAREVRRVGIGGTPQICQDALIETLEVLFAGKKFTGQEEQDKAFFARLPDPCVYCGPSVRGVARQFTVYHGGIPDALKEFIKEHQAARGLIVSVERFAQMHTRLETPGTGELILFRKVRAEL